MIINNLLVYVFTIFFIITLECTLSTYKKKMFTVKPYAVLRRQQSHTFHLPHLDLILGCFVQPHAAKACSLGAIRIQHAVGV